MASPAADSPSSKAYSTDPALYIYTSLTAGSSFIVTATSRLETILRANRVPFKAIDIATDEKARMLWGRRAGKAEDGHVRKMPALVQMGMVLGDLVEIEEWNEYGELKQHVTIFYDDFTQPPISQKPKTPPPRKPAVALPPPASSSTANDKSKDTAPPPAPPLPVDGSKSTTKKPADAPAPKVSVLPIRSIAEEAAAKAKQVHLQSLRDKVYGKGAKDKSTSADGSSKKEETPLVTDGAAQSEKEATAAGGSEKTKAEEPVATPQKGSSSVKMPAGLQSPTSGAWKDGASADELLRTVQSPTSTSWKPVDVEAPVETHQGARLSSASVEEIKAVEQAETIEEVPEEEEEED